MLRKGKLLGKFRPQMKVTAIIRRTCKYVAERSHVVGVQMGNDRILAHVARGNCGSTCAIRISGESAQNGGSLTAMLQSSGVRSTHEVRGQVPLPRV